MVVLKILAIVEGKKKSRSNSQIGILQMPQNVLNFEGYLSKMILELCGWVEINCSNFMVRGCLELAPEFLYYPTFLSLRKYVFNRYWIMCTFHHFFPGLSETEGTISTSKIE